MDKYNPNFYMDAADDAEMIQRAVDAAAETGDRVVIPRKNLRTGEDIWILPRAVKLFTGSAVCLDNCRLRQADDSFDNIFKNSIARTEEGKKLANRQFDIHIYGLGNAVLDGGNHNGLIERNAGTDGRPSSTIVNCPIHMANAERIVVENLRIVNSRYWGMCFHYCTEGRVSNICFLSCGNCPNQDGVDLRTGCSSFIIENITGYTEDDTVALTCLEGKGIDHFTRVEGMDDSIHNVIIRNISSCTLCAQVRLLNNWGKKLYNIIIENVQSTAEYDPSDARAAGLPIRAPLGEQYLLGSETTCATAEAPYWKTFDGGDRRAGASVRIGENWYFDPNDPSTKAKLGDTYNITVRNVQSRMQYPVIIGRTLADSVIDNIQAFGDAVTAVYFDGGEYDNIRVSAVSYTSSAAHRKSDEDAACENPGLRQYKHCAAVYFNSCTARGLRFDGLVASRDSKYVFGGGGDVELSVRDITVRNPSAQLTAGTPDAPKITLY